MNVSLVLRVCAGVAVAICPWSMAWAGNDIPIVVHWEGDQPSEIKAQEDSGPVKLRPNAASRTFEGKIAPAAGGIRRVPFEVRYGPVTFPLELRIRPATRNIEFTIISNRPESCSDPYVSAVRQRTSSADVSIRQALTATHMLAREGPTNHCTHHRAAVLRARFERYANLMTQSPHFLIPKSVETSFLEEMAQLNQANAARQLIDRYREIQVANTTMVLQKDLFASLNDGSRETALASSQAIEVLAEQDPMAARVIFGTQIERDALVRQTSDLAAQVAFEQSEGPR
jgi:hypothetical protein